MLHYTTLHYGWLKQQKQLKSIKIVKTATTAKTSKMAKTVTMPMDKMILQRASKDLPSSKHLAGSGRKILGRN